MQQLQRYILPLAIGFTANLAAFTYVAAQAKCPPFNLAILWVGWLVLLVFIVGAALLGGLD